MAAKQPDTNAVMSNAGKGKELENELTENESEIEGDGSEFSHVDCDEHGTPKDSEVGFGSSFPRTRHYRTIPPFLQKLYDILKDDEFNNVVSWSCTGTSFIIKNVHSFSADVLPMYFKHNNFQSFMSQLNAYCFKKISWEKWEYKNEHFRKGERSLLKNIRRRDNCSRRILPSLDTKSSCSINMENELTLILMKEHHQVKAEIMKLQEKQQILDEKVVSLGNQATSNKEDRKRMMLIAQRILKNSQRKLEMVPTLTQDNEENMVLNEQEMEEMHHSNTFISLEELFGKEYVRDVLENASNHTFGLGL